MRLISTEPCAKAYTPESAHRIWHLLSILKKRRRQGNKIILWTCREGERLLKAVDWCWEHGLAFDAVNENLPEMIEWHGNDCRKIFADVYIDDKSVNKPKYHVPYREEKCHD